MSTPEAGGPGGEDAPSEAGANSNDGEESRLARLRRRLSPRRSEPSPPTPAPPKPPVSPEPPQEEKKPKRSGELAFRARTRLRAIRYWLREKAQIAWRWLKRTLASCVAWWSRRSRGTKIRTGAVAGLVVLYLIIKFLPVPGVPCQVSAAKECAPSNDTIAYVPRKGRRNRSAQGAGRV